MVTETVWKSSKSRNYFIDGQSVALPVANQIRRDLPDIAKYIHGTNHYDSLDRQLTKGYRQQLQINQPRLLELEVEAFQFIKQSENRFPRHTIMVSFSGGKDSTVVSDLVRRALARADVLHIFGDTKLEDENTYEYVKQFQVDNPLIPFFNAQAEHDFFDLVDEIGPPSRAIRWCCTIFKSGPINTMLQSFGHQKILTFYGIRRDESTRRSKYHKISSNGSGKLGVVVKVDQDDELNGVTVGAKIGQQATASPIIDWTEFDVWNYILSYGLAFNKSYQCMSSKHLGQKGIFSNGDSQRRDLIIHRQELSSADGVRP